MKRWRIYFAALVAAKEDQERPSMPSVFGCGTACHYLVCGQDLSIVLSID